MSQNKAKRSQLVMPGDEVKQKFHCDSCQANLTDGVRVSCNECPDFDLCTTCFSRGVEIGSHRNDHAYRVVSRHRFPVFTEDWSADEELFLIDGLRQFGMGNWKDAAEYVGTKTKEECERHYNDVYVSSDAWPLPDMDREFDTTLARSSGDKRNRNATPSKAKVLSSQPSNHEIIGYMPGRLEFETEFENEAEQVIKDMVVNDDDSMEEVELKQTVLKIYNNKLDRRIYRKSFIFDRGLLEYRKNQAIEKRRPKDERDLLNKIKVFARMQTREDAEAFSNGMLNEHALRQRIAQLQNWRRNGITTFEDGLQYEAERSQRLSRRATTQRDSAQLLERLQKVVTTRSQRDAGAESITLHKQPVRKMPPNPLDIEGADGINLLSDAEKELCSRLRIFPRPYLVIKQTLLSEYARVGSLRRPRARELVHIDASKTRKIYNFFVGSGWIKAPSRPGVHAAVLASGSITAPSSGDASVPAAPAFSQPTAASDTSEIQVKSEY
ncbi:Transcriptional adapter ada2 [Coemansia sp. RSA 1813]|nr:Transcriptional adapter ada2 [Coemansia sp. RSA 1646]KAJ1771480.1 Transcriptional adapter ada2 [Coemansia sp. RSA 1843]KAJ2093197.1 Transcriptional adapter ada2 [Coemansia sp. RSA 986]KAJ2217538.1 Transcriptional adapter ada2 [Coemansia sp. RSA 487]KAJ2573451.1 Transcriptional adapter ada2 [Coemansia sp. RSA 1813]